MDFGVIVFSLNCLILVTNVIIFLTIKFNDLKHLSAKVDKVEKGLDRVFTKLEEIKEKQIERDAVCNERHPKQGGN